MPFDLLFILFMVALFLWDTNKKSKQKKKKQAPVAHREILTSAPSDEWKKVFGQEDFPREIGIPMPQRPLPVVQELPKTVERAVETPRKKQKQKSSSKQKQPKTVAQPTVASSASPVRFRTVDDARRAFIYSEIFNRKY